MKKKCCGNCGWWEKSVKSNDWGHCEVKPFWIYTLLGDKIKTSKTEGENCKMWKDKE